MSNMPKHYPGPFAHGGIASRRAADIDRGESVIGLREDDPEYRSPEECGWVSTICGVEIDPLRWYTISALTKIRGLFVGGRASRDGGEDAAQHFEPRASDVGLGGVHGSVLIDRAAMRGVRS